MKHIRFIAFLLAFSMLICAFSACKEEKETSSEAESQEESSGEVVSSQPESSDDNSEANSENSDETSTENSETSDENSETSDDDSQDETSSDHNYCDGCLDLSEFEDDWMYEVDEDTWDSFFNDTVNYYNVTVKITATYCPGAATYFKSDDDTIFIGDTYTDTDGLSRFECLYLDGDNYYYGQNRTTAYPNEIKAVTRSLDGRTMEDLVNYSDGDYFWIFDTIYLEFSRVSYSDAEYDWRDNCYRCEDWYYDNEMKRQNRKTHEFHFEDGKLVKVICAREDSYTRTYEFYDYGTTSATVPNRVREKVEAALAA